MTKKIYHCNFCKETSKEKLKMIGSPYGDCFICENCIRYCNNIINHEQIENTKNTLQKLQEGLITYTQEIHSIIANDEQIHTETVKILNKLKTNLENPELLERRKEQIEIVIGMLADNKINS